MGDDGYETAMAPTELLSSTAAASMTDRVTDAVASHAMDLATDVALPAAKMAALHVVKTRAKTIVFGVAALIIVPIVIKKVLAMRSDDPVDSRPEPTPAPEASA